MSTDELRLAWALLVALTVAALVPDVPGPGLAAVWVAALLPGTVACLRSGPASRASATLSALLAERGTRILLLVLLALAGFVALVFSPAAALFAAGLAGSALLVAAARDPGTARGLLGHLASLGGALVLVLVPLELVLRLPPIQREFGLPQERIRQDQRYDRLWERNALRLRSRYERLERRPGVRRVIALGDSFTWGLLIPDSDSVWPARLERELPGPVEVINMGQRGFTTANEAELLSRLGWQFDPDLVIVQYYLNDAYDSRPNFGYAEGRQIFLLPEQFWQGHIRTSALAGLVSRAVNGLVYGVLLRRVETEGRYADEHPGWHQLRAGLREIGDSARARGTPVLFVLFPDLIPGEWSRESYPAREIYQRVAGEARAAGLTVFDLAAAFAAEGGDWKRWWVTPWDSHPNAAAHAVVARAIARHIEELALLPDPSTSHERTAAH